MPSKVQRLPAGSFAIKPGGLVEKKRVPAAPETPRKTPCLRRVVAAAIENGVAGVRIRQDISPPPSPYKPAR